MSNILKEDQFNKASTESPDGSTSSPRGNQSNDQPSEATTSHMECPMCNTPLQKFLIQQNYSIVMCPKEDCEYPFNQEENFDNILYIDDKEIATVARHEFSLDSKEQE